MVDLRAFKGIILALTCVALCLAFVEVTLRATRPWWPAFMRSDKSVWPFDGYTVAGGQLSAMLKEGLSPEEPYRRDRRDVDVYRGVDPARLESAVQPHLRWRRLTVFGATVCELEPIVNLLFEEGVKPAVLVIALDLRMLAVDPSYHYKPFDERVDVSPGRLFRDLVALRAKAAVEDVEGLLSNGFNECFPDRRRIYGRLNLPMASLRMATLGWLGQSVQAMFSPEWRRAVVDQEEKPMPRATAEQLAGFLEATFAKGGLNPKFYSTRGDASRSLVNIIRLSRSAGTEVIILVTPEDSTFRSHMPANALKTLKDLLEGDFGKDAPTVIMLQDALPDDLFYDFFHTTLDGRRAATERLGEELNKLESGIQAVTTMSAPRICAAHRRGSMRQAPRKDPERPGRHDLPAMMSCTTITPERPAQGFMRMLEVAGKAGCFSGWRGYTPAHPLPIAPGLPLRQYAPGHDRPGPPGKRPWRAPREGRGRPCPIGRIRS